MKTDVIRELHIGLIGHPIEIGLYKKDGDTWIGTDAGLLTSYTVTPEAGYVTIARSNQEATATSWDPKENYILITIITE